ncbi:YggS family pyridoxal phosphate-dependent enzyme [Changpingibacter yushuensis]|uniref:YggS family pyridoxal phosphate-dependent enzyme n=1 Tax=Changpingibacter yushuensis TaxID=2758440 RepID=UPI0015F55653|nr:YggS family pyridoxal phosphate-dependent enzyme [Changpingibacter yushuensis]
MKDAVDLTVVPPVEEIAGRFQALQEQVAKAAINAGRKPTDVAIELAVKYQAPERVMAALAAGGTLMGHNIIQQLEATETALQEANAPAHRTHVIGHVQKNKAKKAVQYAQCIETLDSIKLAKRINMLQQVRRDSGEAHGPFDVMLQVNSSGAESQYGIEPAAVSELASQVLELPNLRIVGLMTIGAHTEDTAGIAHSFQIVRTLRDSLIAAGIASATELSMGMTHDMDIAIAEGSTIIRVGTAVFGPREIA